MYKYNTCKIYLYTDCMPDEWCLYHGNGSHIWYMSSEQFARQRVKSSWVEPCESAMQNMTRFISAFFLLQNQQKPFLFSLWPLPFLCKSTAVQRWRIPHVPMIMIFCLIIFTKPTFGSSLVRLWHSICIWNAKKENMKCLIEIWKRRRQKDWHSKWKERCKYERRIKSSEIKNHWCKIMLLFFCLLAQSSPVLSLFLSLWMARKKST